MFLILPMMHLCLMIRDRYVAVTQPLGYALHRGCGGRIALQLGIVWLVSLMCAAPVVTVLVTLPDEANVRYECIPTSVEYMIAGVVLPYCVPACITAAVYSGTSWALHRRERLTVKMQTIARTLMITLSAAGLSVPIIDPFHDTTELYSDGIEYPNAEQNTQTGSEHLVNDEGSAERPNGTGNTDVHNCVRHADMPGSLTSADMSSDASNADLLEHISNAYLPSISDSVDFDIQEHRTNLCDSYDTVDLTRNYSDKNRGETTENTLKPEGICHDDRTEANDMVLTDTPSVIDDQVITDISTIAASAEPRDVAKCPVSADVTNSTAKTDISGLILASNDCVAETGNDSVQQATHDTAIKESELNTDSSTKAKVQWEATTAAFQRRRRTLIRQRRTSNAEDGTTGGKYSNGSDEKILVGVATEMVHYEGVAAAGTNENNSDKHCTLNTAELTSVITAPGIADTNHIGCVDVTVDTHDKHITCDNTADGDAQPRQSVVTECHETEQNSQTEHNTPSCSPDSVCLTCDDDEENGDNDVITDTNTNSHQTPELCHIVMAIGGLMNMTTSDNNGNCQQPYTQCRDLTTDLTTINTDAMEGRDNLAFVGDNEPGNGTEHYDPKHQTETKLQNGIGTSSPTTTIKPGSGMNGDSIRLTQLPASDSDKDRSHSNDMPKDITNSIQPKRQSILRRGSRQTNLIKRVKFEKNDCKPCGQPVPDDKGSTFNYLVHLEEEQEERMVGRLTEHRSLIQRILVMFIMSLASNLPYMITLTILSVCPDCWPDTDLVSLLEPFRWLALASSFLNQVVVITMDPGIRPGCLRL